MAFQEAGVKPIVLTVVAIDKDKNSQYAVKWALDHLLTGKNRLILVHVQKNLGVMDREAERIFIPYRAFCARKTFNKVQPEEVLLEDTDVAGAILNYVNSNLISNLVLGGSTRNAFVKTFMKPDVPSCLTKSAPDFCSVYVIGKSKVLSVRSAQRSIPNTATPPKRPEAASTFQHQVQHPPLQEYGPRAPSRQMNAIGGDRGYIERNNDRMMKVGHARPLPSYLWQSSSVSMESIDGTSSCPDDRSSICDDDSILDPFASHNSLDVSAKNFDLSFVSDSSYNTERQSTSSLSYNTERQSTSSNAAEVEMRRLRLELQQTMDMYSTACREAMSAKHKANELNDWKIKELQRYEQSRYLEESALASVEMEKAKYRAAMEAAQVAQKLAEKEAQKRKVAELKAKQETEEKNRVLTKLAHTNNDIRYRKYTIDEIEVATEKFAPHLMVGEGGYGPVFRGNLDHTPVAIKILRPDAAQGRKQFQQEVEVLSCMRHPHMVLLLGACPEYGCLVYEYMNNGSLEDRLHRKGQTRPIPWGIRFKIAAEIATGLSFLHQAKPEPLVHRDLKPANILLDHNYVSKISDVGLARLVPPSVADNVTQYHMTSAAGTFCYIDPEYQQSGMLTTKSDVYSLGILLLEIITAKPAMGLSHQVERSIEYGTFSEILDPSVDDWPLEETLAFAKLALQCCELRKRDRPDLSTVVLPALIRLRDFGMNEDVNSLYSYHLTNQSLMSRPRSSLGQDLSFTSSSSGDHSSHTIQSVGTAPWASHCSDDSRGFAGY